MVVINLFPKSVRLCEGNAFGQQASKARLAQSAERKALNLVVVGSSPTVGACATWTRAGKGVGDDLVHTRAASCRGGWRVRPGCRVWAHPRPRWSRMAAGVAAARAWPLRRRSVVRASAPSVAGGATRDDRRGWGGDGHGRGRIQGTS